MELSLKAAFSYALMGQDDLVCLKVYVFGVLKLVKVVMASLIQKKPNFLQFGQAKVGDTAFGMNFCRIIIS